MPKVRLIIVDDAYDYYKEPESPGIELIMDMYDDIFIKKLLKSGKTIIVKYIEE